jgi:tetratricopeptide (TPR) repeat protein
LGTAEPAARVERPERAAGPRSALLGMDAGQSSDEAIVSALNTLAKESRRPVVVLFDDAGAADDDSLLLLRRIVTRPGWLKVPVVVSFRRRPDHGQGLALLDALVRREGDDALVAQSPAGQRSDEVRAPFSALPYAVRRVLRASATVGSGFEAALVARLLDTTELDVLERLQEAHDAGFPLEDLGGSRFHLPATASFAALEGLLGSLQHAWHLRLAALLGQREVATAPAESPAAAARREAFAGNEGAGPATEPSEEGARRGSAAELAADSAPAAPLSSDRSSGEPIQGSGAARVAAHLKAARQYDQAAQAFREAALEAAALGAPLQAVAYDREALELLEALPATPARRLMRVQTLVDLGRYQWEATGPGGDFTLEGALGTAYEANALLEPESDPAALVAGTWRLIANIHYDIGDSASLERALDFSTRAIRLLQSAGDALGAAGMLNDQAAIFVRIGDPVRANHLLTEARRIFEGRAENDPQSLAELAQTDLLLARLPLHVGAKPGRRADALELGIAHAMAAERAYERLDMLRERARAWETIGRLSQLAGMLEEAAGWLRRAVDTQQQLGDVIGLARSAEALAGLHARAGQFEEALALLSDSLLLNLEKGSSRGVMYLQQSLQRLVQEMPDAARAGLAPAIEELHRRIESGAELV